MPRELLRGGEASEAAPSLSTSAAALAASRLERADYTAAAPRVRRETRLREQRQARRKHLGRGKTKQQPGPSGGSAQNHNGQEPTGRGTTHRRCSTCPSAATPRRDRGSLPRFGTSHVPGKATTSFKGARGDSFGAPAPRRSSQAAAKSAPRPSFTLRRQSAPLSSD